MKIQEIIKALSTEIPYQWRVQSRNKEKTKAICTSFVDARDIQNLLDNTCTWEVQFRTEGEFIVCKLVIHADDGTFSREDFGNRIETDENDQMYEQAGKSAASDAFKRAAVMFGASRFIYNIPPVTLPCDQYGNVVDDAGQRVWDLSKHIGEHLARKKKASAGVVLKKSPDPAPKPEEEPKSRAELPTLQPKQFDAMVKAISEGKISDVEEALPKYTLNLAQKTTLNKLIKDAKSKADTNKKPN